MNDSNTWISLIEMHKEMPATYFSSIKISLCITIMFCCSSLLKHFEMYVCVHGSCIIIIVQFTFRFFILMCLLYIYILRRCTKYSSPFLHSFSVKLKPRDDAACPVDFHLVDLVLLLPWNYSVLPVLYWLQLPFSVGC